MTSSAKADLVTDAYFRSDASWPDHRSEKVVVTPTPGSTFEARYPGRCAGCDGKITPGQEVEYGIDNQLEHVECPDPIAVTGEACSTCWLVKAANGSCGCE